MSLAPGEELTLEQKVFSKREQTYEELSDREQTLELEMNSTLTTELNESLDVERSRTAADTNSMGLHVGGEIYGIQVDAGPTSSTTVTDADRNTERQSLKKTQTASAKVAGVPTCSSSSMTLVVVIG